jgi:tripartite-type tricarboxylate transporter receptor subunit TctC
MLVRTFAGLALCIFAAAQPCAAQIYPSRPVTIVAPYAAGGGADLIARLMAQKLSERLGQSFVVENRLGAGGVIAANSVARATPDGYTLFMGASTQLAIQVTLHKTLPYDPATDFVPVALVASVPFVLIVNPSLPVHSVAELIALARQKPGQLTFGSSGVGGPPHLFTELLKTMTGIEMTHIPYKGTAQAMTDVIAGHIPTMFVPLPEAMPQAEAGKVRMIAVSDDKRSRGAPDVPTIAESGYPGYRGISWNGLLAPAATPRDIVNRIAAEFARAAKDPKFIEKLDTYGVEPLGLTPEEFAKFIPQDMAFWAEAVKIAGVTLQ